MNMLLMSVSHARLLRLGDLETMSLEENTLTDGIEALTLTAGAEQPSSEEPAMSGITNIANDATNGSAMASGSKKDTTTGLRIMQVVCDDTFKASACLTRASALVDGVGDE